MKSNYLMILMFFISNVLALALDLKHYNIQNNCDVNPTLKSTFLIKTIESFSKVSCLSECNLNKLCLSVAHTYNQLASSGICCLFSTNFTVSQLINSINCDYFVQSGFYFSNYKSNYKSQ